MQKCYKHFQDVIVKEVRDAGYRIEHEPAPHAYRRHRGGLWPLKIKVFENNVLIKTSNTDYDKKDLQPAIERIYYYLHEQLQKANTQKKHA
mgnify:CR=1 FL=1